MNEQEKLTELLSDMDVPEIRRELNEANLGWMSRNLLIRNGRHPRFHEAIDLVKRLLRRGGSPQPCYNG